MATWSVRTALLATATALFCSACSSPSDPNDNDCAARVRYQGAIYRGHNLLNQHAPRGRMLGTADIIGCGGPSAHAVDTARVYAVKGVQPGSALLTVDKDWRGVYVVEGLSPKSWPTQLKG
jgi:uncharacterized protein DUF6281